MQPSANMKPRAELHQSAPSAMVRAMSKALTTLPAAPIRCAAQVQPDQRVVHQQQAFLHGRADVVGELQRRGTGAALGAVDHDEVGRDAGGQHGLGDGEPFPGVADAQLEAGGLAARQARAAGR
jgi:hypothetical protein